MDNSIEQFAATPIEVKLDENTSITLSPITFGDMGKLNEWVKKVFFDAAVNDMGITDSKERISLWRELRSTQTPDEMLGILMSTDGIIKQIWFSAKHTNPEITVEELNNILDTQEKINMCLDIINDFVAGEQDKDSKNQPTPIKKSAKKSQKEVGENS